MLSTSPVSGSPNAVRIPAMDENVCQKAKAAIDPYRLEEVLEFYPEARAILEYAHRFFDPIHNYKDLPEATRFYSQIVNENESIFSTLTTQDKARLLFDRYIKMLLPIIEDSPNFLAPFSQLQARLTKLNASLPEGKILLNCIRKIVEKDIRARHSGFPEIAICHCLGADYKDISISGESSPIVADLVNRLSISPSVNEMFHRLIKYDLFYSAGGRVT
ncbi:MAG: hypothetical protein ABSA17_06210 [Rhabdochlamydiaceae bacterium]|jgi:hypothetical protein